MRTYINFQYKAKGKRPDDITLTDVKTELTHPAAIPTVGDIVCMQIASCAREFRDVQPGSYRDFQVIGRNFAYATQDGMGSEKFTSCAITILVETAPDEAIGTDVKQ